MKFALLPTRDAVLLPGAVNDLNVGRPGSVAAIRYAAEHDERVLVLLQKNSEIDNPGRAELHELGTLCTITSAERDSPEAATVRMKGTARARVLAMERRGDALFAEIEELPWNPSEPPVPEPLASTLPFLIEIALGERRPGLSRVEQLCYLSVVAPLDAAQLQQVLETEELQPIVAALASLRDESWLARFLRWIRK